MKEYGSTYNLYESSDSKEPRFVVQISWDLADTDYTYLTSSSAAAVPTGSPAVDVIHGVVTKISGQTQKINPNIANSTIGGVSIDLIDLEDTTVSPSVPMVLTAKINTKLDAGDGLRGRTVRVYVGYEDLTFDQYDLRLTYIIDSITYKDGMYQLVTSDIQRQTRHKIFTPNETTLNSSIAATDLLIPITTSTISDFPTITNAATANVRPGETVGYVKLQDEVICHTGVAFDTTIGWHLAVAGPVGLLPSGRGALGTAAVEHTVSSGTEDDRKPKITEHIYIDGPAPKIIYALLTGILLNGNSPEDTLPSHWHLGIDSSFIKLTDFYLLGDDVWNVTADTGRPVRIENPGTQDGKKYIEKEMLLWMGCFMPVYSNGQLGIKKLKGVLSDASYLATLNEHNLASYSTLTHDFRSVINDIRVHWNWVDAKKEFTKGNVFIDATSISKHDTADATEFSFHTVHTGVHTDEDLLEYFNVLRDRYSGPPLILSVKALPSMSHLEVGDTVRVSLQQIRDFNTGAALDRTFEVQQVSTDWMTGDLSFSLFGSSQAAGAIDYTEEATDLLDTFYTQAGTSLDSSDSPAGPLTIVAGHVTANGTITGHATDIDNASAIFYYNGDLIIDAGVTVTLQENVQLRIKGSLEILGVLDGAGNGATGGAATTQFVGGGTTDIVTKGYWSGSPAVWVPASAKEIDYDNGEKSYFGTTIPAASLYLRDLGTPQTGALVASDNVEYFNDIAASSVGVVDVLPHRRLTNDQQTNTLIGYRTEGTTYPGDFRGNAGGGGIPLMTQYAHDPSNYSVFTRTIVANGGAGGDGGAGLLIICRGMSFSGAGAIDLSGGDSSAGAGAVWSTKTVYAGSGAPGAPGTLRILIDGDHTPPDITDNTFVANYGDCVHAASVDEVGPDDMQYSTTVNGYPVTQSYTLGIWGTATVSWPHTLSAWNGAPYAATELISRNVSAHKIQFIPADDTPVIEEEQTPANVTGFRVSQNGDVVVLRWDSLADIYIAGYEIRYGEAGVSFANATPLTSVTKATSVTTADVPPGTWRFYIVAVNESTGQYSETPALAILTVTALQDIIYQTAEEPDWTGTLTNFIVHITGVLVPLSQDADSSQSGNTSWALDNVFAEYVHNPYETCTYEAAEIDVGFDDEVRVWGPIESALGYGETGVASPKLSIDYKLAAGAYDGFEDWNIGNVDLRYVKMKVTLDTTVGLAYISSFVPTVDVLEHTQSATGVAIAAGGTTITYPLPYHNTPFVSVFMTGTSALIPVRSNLTATSFKVQVFNTSGTDVGGTVDWTAIGA